MIEEGPQAKRTRDLIERYASFRLMPKIDRSRIIHICGILSYLEIADEQNMTIPKCKRDIEKFLEKIKEKYIGTNEENGDDIIEKGNSYAI